SSSPSDAASTTACWSTTRCAFRSERPVLALRRPRPDRPSIEKTMGQPFVGRTAMKTSSDRILTSHVGSLPRPPDLLKLIKAKVAGQPYDEKELAAEVRKSTEQCVKRQADIGLDVISDGEMSKPSFLTYIVERLGGVETTSEPFGNPWKGSRENNSFPEYYAWEASLGLNPAVGAKRVICNGALKYKGHKQGAADIAAFKAGPRKGKGRGGCLSA